MRLQSSMGRLHYLPYRTDLNINGYVTIARVLKVHHKSGTADIQLLRTGDTFVSSEENEGVYGVRIAQAFAGYDADRQKAWGTVSPISEGSYVLVTFLDQMKSRPVIIGQLPHFEPEKNVYPSVYPLREKIDGFDRQEALKHLTVYPSQAFWKVDGESNVEFAHASKSFFAIFNDTKYPSMSDEDGHLAMDHDNLSESFVSDLPNAQQPANLLYVHRTDFDDDKTTWTKFFINRQGTLRITRDNNDGKLSYLELTKEGILRFRRQNDDPNHGKGQDYSEITHQADGSITITRNTGTQSASITLTNDGQIAVTHSSGSQITMDGNGNLYIEAGNGGEIVSESLSNFIEQNHIVVSDKPPANPQPYLIWIDTSV